MKRQVRMLPLPMAIAALILGAAPALAEEHEDELEFDVTEIFFELNDTDGDLGIHALIDGDPWKRLKIEGPDERNLLDVKLRRGLRQQGLTEFFFESAEPTFDELDPADFFARFPEGEYEAEGVTIEGEEIEGETEVTHLMPAPAEVTVNGEPLAEVCDDEDPDYDATEIDVDDLPIVIAWDDVTMSHPDADGPGAGVQPPEAVTIVNYEVVVETEIEVNGEEFETKFSVILPPEETSMTVPDEFIAQAEEFKYEVLAREESYNQTAIESCFVLVDE